jgi:hypothetical protein
MTHFNDCLGERKIMTRDLLRTVITKQRVRSNKGFQPVGTQKRIQKRTSKSWETTIPKRRPVSESTKPTFHENNELASDNSFLATGNPTSLKKGTMVQKWMESGSLKWETSFNLLKKSGGKKQSYPFSLLETIFSENSIKQDSHALDNFRLSKNNMRGISRSPSSRSLVAPAVFGIDLAKNQNPNILTDMIGSPGFSTVNYRKSHRSGRFRASPNTFE